MAAKMMVLESRYSCYSSYSRYSRYLDGGEDDGARERDEEEHRGLQIVGGADRRYAADERDCREEERRVPDFERVVTVVE